MQARYSDFLVRRRRRIMVVAVTVTCVVMATSALLPTVPGLDIVVLGLIPVLVLLDAGSIDRRADGFVVTDDGFAVPGSSLTVTAGLVNLCLLTAYFVLGVHDDAVAWGPWSALLVACAAPLAVYGFGLWHGVGVTLTPRGLDVGKLSGSMFVPWEALAAEQYEQDTAGGAEVVLRHARPALIRTVGLPVRTDVLTFSRTRREFVAAAVRHYVSHPRERSAIGTAGGYERLRSGIAAEAPVPRPPIPPAGTRRRIRTALAGGALVAVATPLWLWTDSRLDGTTVGELINPLLCTAFVGIILLTSAAVSGASVSDGGGSRRPGDAPPPASRPTWARDVTRGSRPDPSP